MISYLKGEGPKVSLSTQERRIGEWLEIVWGRDKSEELVPKFHLAEIRNLSSLT